MAIFVVSLLFFFLISFASSATSSCDERCLHQSKAAFFRSNVPLSSGACGYGPLAPGFNGGYLAAGVSTLFRNGVGCGACFHVKCKNPRLCRGSGTNVIVTDIHKSNETDFVLSSRAFISMAAKGMAKELLGQGIVDVEYKRTPCQYKSQNLSFGSSSTSLMKRNFGAVWDLSPIPEGPLLFRLVVIGGYDRRMVTTEKPLPADWKAGEIYDLGVQINDVIAQDGCSPCTDA
ncbi:Expansin/pollen allergen [Macleaya cordata]|uniref:Expansin/pollen allergen n=1 Tax=Macleaya cordata TaxID=56857 RepID=A0A200QZZ3_MACCD|nr:Expansin/pollen allergen [Macleaya cordata]